LLITYRVPSINYPPPAHTPSRGQANGNTHKFIHSKPQGSFLDAQSNARTHQFENTFSPQQPFSQQSTSHHEGTLDPNMQRLVNAVRGTTNLAPATPAHKRKRGPESDQQYGQSPNPTVSQDKGFDNTAIGQSPSQPPKKKGRPPTKAVFQSQILSPEELETQKQEYMAIGAAYAQFQTDNKRSIKNKTQVSVEVKARKRWTEYETGTLISLVEQFGISWAQIKRWDEANGDFLSDRDQVNLKDKARNIKFDLLKGRHPLPKNFEQVTLSATMKQKLQTMSEEDAARELEAAHIAATAQIGQGQGQAPPRLPPYPSAYQPPSEAAEDEEEEEPAFETQTQ
jgi:hypothetical protein